MIPLSPKDLQSGIVRAWATNLLTGETQELTTKNDRSTCQFFKPFECGGYKIQLRLHWKDLDNQGNPMLDADFINPSTDKMDKTMRADPAHHTPAQGDGERIYLWEFKDADESRKLRVMLAWSESLTTTGHLSDVCSNKLFREGKEIP
jgi:hypothetical protein